MRYLFPLAVAALLSFLTACNRDASRDSPLLFSKAPAQATAVPTTRSDTSQWADTTVRGDTTVLAWGKSITTVVVSVDSTQTTVFPRGIAFGLWGLTGSQLGALYNATVIGGVAPWKELPAIKLKNGKAVLNLADTKTVAVENGDTVLSVKAATAFMQTWDTAVVMPRVRDGTIISIGLSDDITDKNQWGPGAPYYARIDSIGCAAKKIFPGVKTSVRAMPTQYFAGSAIAYKPKCVTYLWAQYVTRLGAVTDYKNKETRRADSLGVCLIFGLNTTKGGNGSSGVKTQSTPDLYQMSSSEVLAYTKVLLPYTPVFLGWWAKDDKITNLLPTYKTVRSIADTTARRSCKR